MNAYLCVSSDMVCFQTKINNCNIASKISFQFGITLFSAQVTIPEEKYNRRNGSDLQVPCSSRGFPRPDIDSIEWVKGGNRISSDPTGTTDYSISRTINLSNVSKKSFLMLHTFLT